jgi:hypothetical protein
MQYLLHGLKRHGIGQRALTEPDFFSICDRERITVVWSELAFAFYFSTAYIRCITLPKRHSGNRLLFLAFHELGHHFAHAGCASTVCWNGLTERDKNEVEADAIALVAMFPNVAETPLILDNYTQKLWSDRKHLYFLYGV